MRKLRLSLIFAIALILLLNQQALFSQDLPPRDPSIPDITWSPDGQFIAYAIQNGTIQVMDADSQQIVQTLYDQGDYPAYAIAWSPDGLHLAFGKGVNLHVWDTSTWIEEYAIQVYPNNVNDVEWSSDSTRLVTTSSGELSGIEVWDATTGTNIIQVEALDVSSADFSPDMSELVYTSSYVAFYDMTLHTAEYGLAIPGFAISVDWHSSMNILVASSTEGIIQTWDLAIPAYGVQIEGHTDRVRMVKWSPDGTRIASAGNDGFVKIWDASTGQELQSIDAGEKVFAVAWNPDGSQIVYGTESGLLEIITVEQPAE